MANRSSLKNVQADESHLHGTLGEIIGQDTVAELNKAVEKSTAAASNKFSAVLGFLRRNQFAAIIATVGVGAAIAVYFKQRKAI